ncbi:MAG TPA: hypothetical protein P5080_03435 [Candidatus Paceibacterota bacterium]|nr:hypothetical protein [Candidatus Pacearchaeota archaeon]HRZ51018.1 hypothetical protein [Candidatus Paceibacterota bacterium]HSA36739.1 hypothetical protein [Candidatus Paceibacterota bacterium]
MPGVCEKCLEVAENDLPRMKCSCGHETAYDAAKMLYSVIRESGEQRIQEHLVTKISYGLANSENLLEQSVIGLRLNVNWSALIDDLRFDVTKCVNDETIMQVGQKVVAELIEDKKEELFTRFGLAVHSIVAANIVAFLYDAETKRYARTVVQDISRLGLENYYLGKKVAAQNNSGLVYAPRVATSIIIAFGDAKLEAEAYHGHILTRISKASYPLGIIVRTCEIDSLNREREFENARLFIFV